MVPSFSIPSPLQRNLSNIPKSNINACQFATFDANQMRIAIRIERAAVEAAGVSWSTYEGFMKKYEKAVESEKLQQVPVISAAEQVMLNVLEAYAEPDKSFDDLRRKPQGDQFTNRLKDFSAACRNELRDLTE